MILHTIIIKWKAGTSKSDIDTALTGIKGLAGIDGVTDLAFGPVLRKEGQDFDFVLSMRVPSKEFLEQTYLPHPVHMRVVGSLGKMIGSALIVDAEV